MEENIERVDTNYEVIEQEIARRRQESILKKAELKNNGVEKEVNKEVDKEREFLQDSEDPSWPASFVTAGRKDWDHVSSFKNPKWNEYDSDEEINKKFLIDMYEDNAKCKKKKLKENEINHRMVKNLKKLCEVVTEISSNVDDLTKMCEDMYTSIENTENNIKEIHAFLAIINKRLTPHPRKHSI